MIKMNLLKSRITKLLKFVVSLLIKTNTQVQTAINMARAIILRISRKVMVWNNRIKCEVRVYCVAKNLTN